MVCNENKKKFGYKRSFSSTTNESSFETDSEITKQVMRFREGHPQHELVLKLSIEWFISLINNYSRIQVNEDTNTRLSSYRPLNYQNENIQIAIAKMKKIS
jgi:hypothetical protein